MLDECTQTIRAPSAPQPAWERVTNYEGEELRKTFCNARRRGGGEWVFMGHSQTTYDPGTQEENNTSYDDDALDIIHDSDWKEKDEGGCPCSDDGCPSRNLFASFELQANDEKESKYALLQRKLRSFLSIYAALGTDEQLIADNRVDTLVSQTRVDYARNQKQCGGTRSIITEQHGMRVRTFKTHNPYFTSND